MKNARQTLRIVSVSDTHGLHEGLVIPAGDVLVHAGDITAHGTLAEVEAFADWLARLPHRHKIVIAGNHDFAFERQPAEARSRLRSCIYLEDEAVTVEGVSFYGSPWQPWFYDWAFNLRRGRALREKWALIPVGTRVLVTHGPPRGHGGLTERGEDAGCEELAARVRELRPALHVFGHIHEGYGVTESDGTTFVNASICTLAYEPTNAPIVSEVELTGD